ncbi:hypothetical protein [Dactylosporangium sp. NPDC006015]|uniref:hypothetical protein n=1 Tax=Dactylosporangium sp. NPDC006015 TaxID=3154576 RepID=UPI0033B38750
MSVAVRCGGRYAGQGFAECGVQLCAEAGDGGAPPGGRRLVFGVPRRVGLGEGAVTLGRAVRLGDHGGEGEQVLSGHDGHPSRAT